MKKILINTFSILFIFLFIFNIIAPLIVNVYSYPIVDENKYLSTQGKPDYEVDFTFSIPGYADFSIPSSKIRQFQLVEIAKKDIRGTGTEFDLTGLLGYDLVGIVDINYDVDLISKTIAKGISLGMNENEIIKEIENKHSSRIINKNGKKIYTYSIGNEKINVSLNEMRIDRMAKGGVAIIFPVEESTIIKNETMHEVFTLKSKCVNDDTENLGKIYIIGKYFSLPYSIELLKGETYHIGYAAYENYEFDHWEIIGGRLSYQNNLSNNILIVENNYGEIIAFYRKIGIKEGTTTTSSITSLKTSTTSSSIRTTKTSTTSIKTSSSKTQSLTSSKTEIKTTSSILTTSSIKQEEENFVDSYIITPIKEYIINPIIKYIIEPINEYIIKPFTKYVIEPILKFIIQPFIEYIIKPIIEIIIKIIEIIKEIIKIILDIFNRIINTITGKNKEISTTIQSFTSYSTKSKTYEKTTSIEEKSTYKEYLISYEKTKYDSTKIIISYETKINTIYITKTIKTIGNKEIITTYPIITTIYESPYITTTTSSITSYKTSSSSSILTTIPKKITTIYEKTSTIKNTEEPITTYKQITTTITSSSLTSSTSISTKTSIKSETPKQTTVISTSSLKTTNIIYTTTISKYTTKTITTITTYPLKTETIYVTITGFTTTYKTPIYTYTTIVTTKKTTSSQNYGGGGGRREGPLLRDSLLSNKELYKEFLNKIKKIEENKRQLQIKYLVYRATPLIFKRDKDYKGMIVYKIHPTIRNYDNAYRHYVLSIAETKKKIGGAFITKPNLNEGFHFLSIFHEVNWINLPPDGPTIRYEMDILAEPDSWYREEYQVFFMPREMQNFLFLTWEEPCDPSLYLYVHYDKSLRLVDAEPDFKTIEYNFEQKVMVSALRAMWGFTKSALPYACSMAFPPSIAFFMGSSALAWVDYYKLKKVYSNDEIIKECWFEALKKEDEFIDVYAKYEEAYEEEKAKIDIESYLKGILTGTVDFFDPTNMAVGAMTQDLYTTMAGQIYHSIQEINNPDLSEDEKAEKIGELAGIIFVIAYASKVHKKAHELLKAFKNKESIIKYTIDNIAIKSRKIAKSAMGLMSIIAMKIKDAEEGAYEFARLMKVLLNHGIKEDDIENAIIKAIKIIDNGEISNNKDLINLIKEIARDEFKIVKVKITKSEELIDEESGKTRIKYEICIGKEDFEAIGGEVSEETYAVLGALKDDGKIIEFIRKVGSPDRDRRLHFKITLVKDEIGQEDFYLIIKTMINNPRDFFKYFGESINGKRIGEEANSILKEASLSKDALKLIIDDNGNSRKIDLKELRLHYVVDEGALGIRGIYETSYGDKIELAICTDGRGKIFMELMESEHGPGRKISDIKIGRNRIIIKYYRGEERTCAIFFDIEGVQKKVIGNKIEWYVKEESASAYVHLSETKAKGNIGEIWALDMIVTLLKEWGYEIVRTEIAQGKRNNEIADIHIVARDKNGKEIIIPVESKSFKYDSETISWRDSEIKDKLLKARKQIIDDFKLKDEYKKDECKFGFIVINALNKDNVPINELNPSVKWIKVDTLIAIVDKATGKIVDYICIPEGYNH